MSEWTQGKWKFRELSYGGTAIIDVDGEYFATIVFSMTKNENAKIAKAKYICQCVNNFNALLEACKATANEWNERGKDTYGGIGAPFSIFKIKQAIVEAEKEK